MADRSRWLCSGAEFDSFEQLRSKLFPSDELSMASRERLLDEAMLVRKVNAESGEIEEAIRWLFLWAIIHRGSDIHLTGVLNKKQVTVSMRTPKGMLNLRYVGGEHVAFREKMFNLANIPQGGSTPGNVAQRFSIFLPEYLANKLNLKVKNGYTSYDVQVRVEYIKSHDGWTFVTRLIDQQYVPNLVDLKLPKSILGTIERVISQPSGLILVTGPTGSGKTTLLYALISHLNNGQRAITTIENPVELIHDSLEYSPVKQIPVEGDLTFAKALRSALRQDPDIIMIGEIRDQETMEIALQAAQTGHLVFATLHANNGIETISRASDLTVDKERDSFRLAESLKLVIASRLLNTYKVEDGNQDLSRGQLEWLSLNGLGLVNALPNVNKGERLGRRSIMEVVEITPEVKREIRKPKINSSAIFESVRNQIQYETLPMAGVRLCQGSEIAADIDECMASLDPASDCVQYIPERVKLAKEFGVSLFEIDALVNSFYSFLEENPHSELTLHTYIKHKCE